MGLLMVVLVIGVILAFVPLSYKLDDRISQDEVAQLRNEFSDGHYLLETSDGETLFIRTWKPDSVEIDKRDLAVLILHGLTAHGGAYDTAAKIISSKGYETFAVDYRGHGLSNGNRGDYASKDRWIADLNESVMYIKSLGYERIVIFGHSLGVGAAIYTAKAIPEEITGLILLSGAYEGKEGIREPPTFFQTAKILVKSVI